MLPLVLRRSARAPAWARAFSTRRAGPPTTDTHVTICPYFVVPEAKLDVFTSAFPEFYAQTRAGTESCLYYGFATCGNTVFCREGYTDAEGAMAHVGDVEATLNAAVEMVGEGGLDLSVMGPAEELEKLRPAFEPLGTRFWVTDPDGMWWG